MIGLIAITSFISALAGLWGVLVTDLLQFVVKMTMVIVLAVAAVHAVGGMEALKMKLAAVDQRARRARRVGPQLHPGSRRRPGCR